MTRPTAIVALLFVGAFARAGAAICTGDCDDNQKVGVEELVTGVNVALGTASVDLCAAIDADDDGHATIDELVTAVGGAIYGCGVIPPTSTPTRTPTDTPRAETSTPTATPTVTPTPAPPLGQFSCTLDPAKSSFRINVALGAIAIPRVTAQIAVDCGAIEGGTGSAPCAARLVSFDPVDVLGIGVACVTPVEGCADGAAACNGGASLDIDLAQDHNIDNCDSNDSCTAACTTHCEGLGKQFYSAGCEGFCQGGPNDGNTCTLDSDCPDAVCVGKEPVTHRNVCNCQCLTTGGAASQPGALLLNLGARIEVEPHLPCGDGDATISLPPVCIPLTTEATTGVILKGDNVATEQIGPVSDAGARLTCEDLSADRTTGLGLVGDISGFDSALGDLEIEIDWACH